MGRASLGPTGNACFKWPGLLGLPVLLGVLVNQVHQLLVGSVRLRLIAIAQGICDAVLKMVAHYYLADSPQCLMNRGNLGQDIYTVRVLFNETPNTLYRFSREFGERAGESIAMPYRRA